MTKSSRCRAGALAAAALLSVSCGPAGALDRSAERRLEGARVDASEALERVDDLEARLGELGEELRSSRRGQDGLERALQRRGERFREVVATLRGSLKELREVSGSIEDDAAAALSVAHSTARDLSVLTRRFDYHLRSTGRE